MFKSISVQFPASGLADGAVVRAGPAQRDGAVGFEGDRLAAPSRRQRIVLGSIHRDIRLVFFAGMQPRSDEMIHGVIVRHRVASERRI